MGHQSARRVANVDYDGRTDNRFTGNKQFSILRRIGVNRYVLLRFRLSNRSSRATNDLCVLFGGLFKNLFYRRADIDLYIERTPDLKPSLIRFKDVLFD